MTDLQTVDKDPRLVALQRWRNQLIKSGAVTRSSFKEAHLRLVLRSGRTEVDEIRSMLPGAVAVHAEDLVRVMLDADGPGHDIAPPGVDLAPSNFAPYAFEPSEHEVCQLSLRRVAAGAGGTTLQASWPPFEPPARPSEDHPCYVVYRLVSTDGGRGYSPDSGELIETTTGTAVTDDRPATCAVRHLQVWANAGASASEAVAAQPVLHAEGVIIGTARDVEIREDSGRVIGRWATLPGVEAIRVYRVPAELAEHDGPAFRIAADNPNMTGFIDRDPERGCRYVYRVRCEVEVDGVVRLSEAIESEIQVSAVREPVTDLTLARHGKSDGETVDLEWTSPRFGQVQIYRTPDPPSADAQATELEGSVLDQVGLPLDALLSQPISERNDGAGAPRSVMAGVPWPDGWNRAYFTPVTVLDNRARLGKPISTVRTDPITDVALTEYCNKQVLTFDWPHGAASVMAYLAPKGHDPRDGLTGRCYEIALADYERYGGMRFSGDLPNGGCALHLVPVAFSGGRRVLGTPVTIEYGGLLRLWYDVRILRDSAGLPLSAAVQMRAEPGATGSPPFVLVHNPRRIPLTMHDGDPVDMYQINRQGKPISGASKEFQLSGLATDWAESEVWAGEVRGLRGWIRLFAHLPIDRLRLLALLDPPVDSLMLTPVRSVGQ